MNPAFLELPEEKKNRIIDSAYKVFSLHEYKKAPMSEIADVGGISKALLFYYFKNKKELYFYLWSLAIEQIHEESVKQKVIETTDFFGMIERSLNAKCNVIRQHPYLYLFTTKAYYEEESEIKELIHKNFELLNKKSEQIAFDHMDLSSLKEGLDIGLLYQEIVWISDGYLHQMVANGSIDADQMEHDFKKLIEQWRKVYLNNAHIREQ